MPETPPAANSPEARTPEGTILDQSQPTQSSTPTETPTNEPAPAGSTSQVPDHYDLKPPEGSALDAAAIESASSLFKELGLTNPQAQKLLDFAAGRDREVGDKSAKVYNDMRADWRSQVEADPQLGGQNLDATKAEIGKAIATLPPKLQADFKDAMNLTGAGDHPAVVKAFYTLAKSVNEGSHVTGGAPSPEGQRNPAAPARPSPAASMFPNLPSASTTH